MGPTMYVDSPESEIWIQRDVDLILGLALLKGSQPFNTCVPALNPFL